MSQFNKETTAEEVCDALSSHIKGKTFLITGTSAKGLGARCATVLAHYSPARLILVSRSKAKVEPVMDEIKSIDDQVSVKFVACELSSQESVRQAAESIMSEAAITKIDVVINNAGVMGLADYTVDDKGNELQLSSNHIGHFLLTNLLAPKILAAGPGSTGTGISPLARIVNLTSHGHRIGPFRFDDPGFSNGEAYDPWSAYGQSKTANALFSVELARRLKTRRAQAYSVHPGAILNTGLMDPVDFFNQIPAILEASERNNPGVPFPTDFQLKSDSQGCATALRAALDPELEVHGGEYLEDCQPGKPMAYAVDAEKAKKLWAYSEEVVGQKFYL